MAIKMPRKRQGETASPEAFIAGATAGVATPIPMGPSSEELPWLDPRVRDDLRVQIAAKLPERLMIQRDWLAARLRLKKQDILEVALRAWVSAELRKLGLDE